MKAANWVGLGAVLCWGVAWAACAQTGAALDKGCAVIHEADAACQYLVIVRADGATVRVPKAEGIAAMRKAGLERPAP